MEMVDKDQGLRVLGVSPKAGTLEIERAYKTRSRAVKTLLLGAVRAAEKERYRFSLRELVRGRDVALGRRPRDQWQADPLGVSARRLIDLLHRTEVKRLDPARARAFFGLSPLASRAAVMDTYRIHARALVRAFANADSDEALHAVRRARGKLRTIRNFALASA
jgi:hypothetical protein